MNEITSAAAAARRLFDERRRRDRLLGGYSSLMGEPAWDMLLALLGGLHDASGGLADAHGAAGGAGAAHWSAVLRRLGLVERRGADEAGAGMLRLSPTGVALMTRVVTGAATPTSLVVER